LLINPFKMQQSYKTGNDGNKLKLVLHIN